MSEICILTPYPGYKENWRDDAEGFKAILGDALTFRPWTDPGDLASFALTLPLLAWGYQRDPSRWYRALDQWEAAGFRFANPIATLRWNTDKDYLLDLEAAGVAIVPTIETHALTSIALEEARLAFDCETLVVKPAISGGADRTFRLAPGDPVPFDVLEREMLIQPIMPAIAEEGEYSLFHFGGRLSHAILKSPAAGDFRVQSQFGGQERAVTPPADALALAEAALSAAPAPPLYARSDMVRAPDGSMRLMELELIEPSLFFGFAADKGRGFADAVFAHIATQA